LAAVKVLIWTEGLSSTRYTYTTVEQLSRTGTSVTSDVAASADLSM